MMVKLFSIILLFLIANQSYSKSFSQDGKYKFSADFYEKCLLKKIKSNQCLSYKFTYGGIVEEKFKTDRVGILYNIDKNEIFISSEMNDYGDVEFFMDIYDQDKIVKNYNIGYNPIVFFYNDKIYLKISIDGKYQKKIIKLN